MCKYLPVFLYLKSKLLTQKKEKKNLELEEAKFSRVYIYTVHDIKRMNEMHMFHFNFSHIMSKDFITFYIIPFNQIHAIQMI